LIGATTKRYHTTWAPEFFQGSHSVFFGHFLSSRYFPPNLSKNKISLAKWGGWWTPLDPPPPLPSLCMSRIIVYKLYFIFKEVKPVPVSVSGSTPALNNDQDVLSKKLEQLRQLSRSSTLIDRPRAKSEELMVVSSANSKFPHQLPNAQKRQQQQQQQSQLRRRLQSDSSLPLHHGIRIFF
jgi:hypothetical protein